MIAFPPTLILRHRRENLKKCSLRGLETRNDLQFYSYPLKRHLPDLTNYVVLTLGAAPLAREDADKGLFLIDGTWRYAEKMLHSLPMTFEVRSLPKGVKTAYPRRQEDCSDPTQGLASCEALYLAYEILGRDPTGLLDHYHWKEEFLKSLTSLPTHG
jgi:pre-rRNA-processing protein TSR3